MFSKRYSALARVSLLGRQAAQVVVASIAIMLAGLTIGSALGYLPWPQIPLSLGRFTLPDAGKWLQIGLTFLLILQSFLLLPTPRGIHVGAPPRLDVGIEDIARAYRIAHSADRSNGFPMASEFESMRARMEYLGRHPDLSRLEPELLRLAAMMSQESKPLADAFSDEKIARAQDFLDRRQAEAQALSDRLGRARAICRSLRNRIDEIEEEEETSRAGLEKLDEELRALLPALGYAIDIEGRPSSNIVPLRKKEKRRLPVRVQPERPDPRV